MLPMATAVTLDADSETNPETGTFVCLPGQTASYFIDITGTITVTLQRRIGSSGWIAVEAGYTADTTKQIIAPGEYRLIASATSGGSAVTFLYAEQ
jgi:hypothetical protein